MRPVRSSTRPKQHRTESKGRPSLAHHSPVVHIACRLPLKRSSQPVASCFWQVASCPLPSAATASILRKHVLFVKTAPPPCPEISALSTAPADFPIVQRDPTLSRRRTISSALAFGQSNRSHPPPSHVRASSAASNSMRKDSRHDSTTMATTSPNPPTHPHTDLDTTLDEVRDDMTDSSHSLDMLLPPTTAVSKLTVSPRPPRTSVATLSTILSTAFSGYPNQRPILDSAPSSLLSTEPLPPLVSCWRP
jgi:hypothetical protein